MFWVASGLWFLGIILFTTFCLVNVVLGIYVRQVIQIAKDCDRTREEKELRASDENLRKLRQLFDSIDVDENCCISTKELFSAIESNVVCDQDLLGISTDDLTVLHSALDAARTGEVPITELLFGVFRLTGSSKRIDIFSVDYRQKTFLRDVMDVSKSTRANFAHVQSGLDVIAAAVKDVSQEIIPLKEGTDAAEAELLSAIAAEDVLIQEAYRVAGDDDVLEEILHHKSSDEALSAFGEHLEKKTDQLRELALLRQLDALCCGYHEDTEALKKAVEERLKTYLSPWLESELREAGGGFTVQLDF